MRTKDQRYDELRPGFYYRKHLTFDRRIDEKSVSMSGENGTSGGTAVKLHTSKIILVAATRLNQQDLGFAH